jgi:hypothetical protein
VKTVALTGEPCDFCSLDSSYRVVMGGPTWIAVFPPAEFSGTHNIGEIRGILGLLTATKYGTRIWLAERWDSDWAVRVQFSTVATRWRFYKEERRPSKAAFSILLFQSVTWLVAGARFELATFRL